MSQNQTSYSSKEKERDFEKESNIAIKNLWIGELEQWMDSNYLIEACHSYSKSINFFNKKIFLIDVPIKTAKIIHDKKTGCSMGYGFLIFDSKEDAENALDVLTGKIMPKANKFFKLNHAVFNNRKNENEHSLYVCDLDPSISAEKLAAFFKKNYKSVTNAKIIIDPITKISRGYGFVIFSDEKEKEKALNEMSGCVLNGKAIRTGNASHKRIEKYKNKMMSQFHQQLFIQQQVQQYYNNPFYMASNYFANLFNPLFQQQIYSQLEDYFNKPTDENDSKDSISNAL